ncbi:lipid-A-disaccharide synthase [Rickettsia endosymbiont of Cardiosporidium cionae]|uniref:lipid-A-disaccharide synthase n=1 Tax=Rickettsia endosymbiont of Cardiosporidium cionae TaxID=2777155 RepID=UPI001E56F826|nr:lipid-A-disaccharide synthase [Rickettsia endosymbiont of Cardiosporidium cionae]KAF8818811.1 lipid-A-disaccharide synthase [Rickettsia endosymbiont of Cardiosporidium cionae]
MKIYLIAGENSGDFIGAKIINALHNRKNNLSIRAIGGNLIKQTGVDVLFDIEQINIMGFAEIIPNIFRLIKLFYKTIEDIIQYQPDVLITIDAPGFSFKIAQKIKQKIPNTRLIHVVAPTVWAYNPNRAIKYSKIYDQLLTLFDFEPKYFRKFGLKTYCIGHPIFEQKFYDKSSKPILRKKYNICDDTKIITITPGARKSEIIRHMPIIIDSLQEISHMYKIKIFILQPNDKYFSLIGKFLKNINLDYSFSLNRLQIFAMSDAVIAKSGSNTLEIAASLTPMVVGYKVNFISYLIIKFLIKIKFITIINIIANKEIIKEYIQYEFTANNLSKSIIELISDKQKSKLQISHSQAILKKLGFKSNNTASAKAAKIILDDSTNI